MRSIVDLARAHEIERRHLTLILDLADRMIAIDEYGPLHILVADYNYEDDHISWLRYESERRHEMTSIEAQFLDDIDGIDETWRGMVCTMAQFPNWIASLRAALTGA